MHGQGVVWGGFADFQMFGVVLVVFGGLGWFWVVFPLSPFSHLSPFPLFPFSPFPTIHSVGLKRNGNGNGYNSAKSSPIELKHQEHVRNHQEHVRKHQEHPKPTFTHGGPLPLVDYTRREG